jgi:hypothetical protein
MFNNTKTNDGPGFKSQVWNTITINFNSNANVNYAKLQIKSKYKDLKGQYETWNALDKNSGFGWDEETQLHSATDDVWERYIAAHPKAAKFRYE